jgi:hypothetical protein
MRVTLIFIFFHITFLSLNAQIVNEPINSNIYSFLERLSDKGIIEVDDLIKPFSRKYIAIKLTEAKNNFEKLTELEKEELDFFMKDYFLELEAFKAKNIDNKYLSYFGEDESGRYRFFLYSDEIFKMNANPILGFGIKYPGKERNLHAWLGISTYGYLINNIGFNLYFRSDNESGNGLDIFREFTPETGIIPNVAEEGKNIAYSEVRASMSIDWVWGNLMVSKDFIQYGYAKMGNIVLSTKAPSFPYISLKIKPVDWFSFTYFHAWLSSTVVDSINLEAYHRNIYRDKYMAWHSLTLTPFKGLDISFGESVVYADRLELLFLMPVSIYYFADEYISNNGDKPGDANQQIFVTVSSKNHIMNTHLYGTLFVDELTIGGIQGPLSYNPEAGIGTERRSRTQLGFTLGLSVNDLPIDNLTLSTEYTRINPFVYGHHDPAQTYTNSTYLMGHWIGHNSDLFYLNVNYRFLRGLQANIWGTYIRKGSSDYSDQYTSNYQPEFLFGLRNDYKYFGVNLKYEILHEFYFETHFRLSKISNEQEDGSFINNSINEFSFAISYGL